MPVAAVHTALPEEGRGPAAARAASRTGTKQVAAHFPEEVAWQLRELAVSETDQPCRSCSGEALNDLFQKYGKPELLPDRRKSFA